MAAVEKPPFHVALAAKLTDQLERGTAPWQKPWEAGASYLPYNPITGKNYRGINAVQLLSEGRSDPRWMTYRQAAVEGGQVRRGERGAPIQYWKFEEERTVTDPDGKPVLDERGEARRETVGLRQPRVFVAVVFNAEQIEGLPPLQKREPTWNVEAAAEARIGLATVRHDQTDRAFYRPSSDTIHLPRREQFPDAAGYYHVAQHELAHWSGHPARLNRDLSNPPGSPEYAREELRAEIASLLMGAETGAGYRPNQNAAAYVSHWVKDLRERPLEVFRAAADAEKIRGFVSELTQQRSNDPALSPPTVEPMRAEQPSPTRSDRVAAVETTPRVYLAVPFGEKNAAKAAGARWDAEKKLWYAPGAEALSRLARWRPEYLDTARGEPAPVSPREEFAQVLQGLGFRLGEDHPSLDGRPRRCEVEGDRRGEAAGFYVAYQDGHPAGYAKNNRTGGEVRWKAKGYTLTEEQRQALAAAAATRLAEREQHAQEGHADAARRIEAQLRGAEPATSTPYLAAKQIEASRGVFADQEGRTLLVPGYDADGKIWTAQYINADGSKRFAKGTRKDGCFHVVGGLTELNRREVIVLAEGYATANTIAAAAEGRAAVVSAFDAGNLEPVARALRERYPDKAILIAADDDRAGERNRGREEGTKAARAVGGECLTPVFAVGEQAGDPGRFSDFNDLKVHSALGVDGLREQILAGIEKAERTTARERDQPREPPPPAQEEIATTTTPPRQSSPAREERSR